MFCNNNTFSNTWHDSKGITNWGMSRDSLKSIDQSVTKSFGFNRWLWRLLLHMSPLNKKKHHNQKGWLPWSAEMPVLSIPVFFGEIQRGGRSNWLFMRKKPMGNLEFCHRILERHPAKSSETHQLAPCFSQWSIFLGYDLKIWNTLWAHKENKQGWEKPHQWKSHLLNTRSLVAGFAP